MQSTADGEAAMDIKSISVKVKIDDKFLELERTILEIARLTKKALELDLEIKSSALGINHDRIHGNNESIKESVAAE